MRAFLVAVCRLLVRIYFSQIEVAGLERVPKQGPVVIVLNHPNGLLDPLFVLTSCGRRVSFLAKEPLFRMPLVGFFVRTFECLPVYRKSDGADPAKNRESVQRAIDLLARGNAIAIFPEGTSHSDPSLMPFRTGAARIALAASSPTLGAGSVQVVPCGLYYEDKVTFRSKVVVTFGEPVDTPAVSLDERFEPPPAIAREFTQLLQESLEQVTLNAPSIEVLRLTALGERLLHGAEGDAAVMENREPVRRGVDEALAIRTQMVEGYQQLVQADPHALHTLVRRLDEFDSFMTRHHLKTEQRVLFPARMLLAYSLSALALSVVLFPLAAIGTLLNFLPYHFVGWLAKRYAQEEDDLLSSGKMVGGMFAYPAFWGLVSFALGFGTRPLWGAVLFLCSPLAAWAALLFLERARHAFNQGYVVLKLLFRPHLRRKIIDERAAIRDAIFELEDHIAVASEL
jgi:1-acyl-sn-glycerol-3-phosphate acyltransferase